MTLIPAERADPMRCPRCQFENRPGRRFCAECGSCPSCGYSNEPGEKFCGGCGLSLTGAAPAQAAPPPPHTYTPEHLAEKIRTARETLEGERKQVTILFADIRGSMELLQGRDPEESRRLLDPVLQTMMDAVHRFEGTVNNLMGDGLMAIFGAPLAHEDHAVRACYAALAMQAMIASVGEDMRREHGVELQVRIGLNSGEVVVRAIGKDLSMDYSAIGPTTHLASRMEQLATPGSIRLTGETCRLAEAYIQVRSLGPVPVKGLAEPVEVFELLGAVQVRRRMQAVAARGLTPFVAREDELRVLDEALERASAGNGRVVAFVGEPGVGKSRLFWEFTRSRRTSGWLLLEAASVSYGKATAYLPVLDLLRSYFGVEPGDDGRKVRERITGKLLALDEALRPMLSAFLALMEAPLADPQWERLDPAQRRQLTLHAVKRLLLRESLVQPVLLVFEDLHWIDSETQALLDTLVEALPSSPLLLLVNYRPEYRHDWSRRSSITQLRIEPLPREGAHELLRRLLGDDPGIEPLRRLLIERTEGNPFFLEESVRALAESGALAGERGAYRLAAPLVSVQVPPTIQSVLAARIDRLPPDAKRLLQCASVIGKDVPLGLLDAVAEMAPDALQRGLARLQEAEFLYEGSLFPEPEYAFTHALTYEVAYGGLLQDRRRALHARIVEAIEQMTPERRAEQLERLAQHAFRGEVWEKAVPYLRQAGAKAANHSANREAAALYERAIAALARLPDGPDERGQEIDVRFELRNALAPLGELERTAEHLRRARDLAEELGDEARLGRAYAYLTNYHWQLGEHERAVDAGRRALALAERRQDPGLRFAAVFYLAQAHFNTAAYREAASLSRGMLDGLETGPRRDRFAGSAFRVLARTWLVWSLAELGDFEEGLAAAAEGVTIARTLEQPFILTHAHVALGAVHLRRGDVAKAIPPLQAAMALMETWDFPVFHAVIAPQLGYAYALAGRLDEGLPLLQRSVDQADAMRLMAGQALRTAWLAEGHLLAGDVDRADSLAAGALDLAGRHGERGYLGWTLRLLGEIAGRSRPPRTAEAERRLRQAAALAEELGMRPLLAQARLGLAELLRRSGRDAEAEAELGAADALLREMGMRRWLKGEEAPPATGS